ncbi:autotransporter assembly complex protein TamA [Flavisphingomonas formosensis]|uniref:autotransporter assembly complex protein TamA n=1 Tax=Flavisphingomonas formosensis TaxID=861534 RepID=UPI001E5637DB|nr:BamA/TamA family outer membrane protein [Sphingomonas formosensis]
MLLAAAAPAVAQPDPNDAALSDPAFDASLPPLEATMPPPAEATPPAPEPAPDPELSTPLPPLGSFDTMPPPNVAVKDDTVPEIPYAVVVKGLDKIGLEGRFRDLSTLLQGKKRAAGAAQVSARASEDVALMERLLRSEGYYDGLASASVNTLPNAENRLTVTLTATPGPRYGLGKIVVTGAPPEPEALALKALNLKTGDPIVAAAIENAEAEVSLRLPEHGYPFVQVGQRDILLDDKTHVGDYTLPVDAGARSVFGGLRTKGDAVFPISHLEIFRRFKPGELYDSRKVDDLRQALIATSMFSTIAVEPVHTGQLAPDGTETVDLMVSQAKGPWRSLAANAGYATGEGIKLTGSWTHRNLFPLEGALIVEAVAGTQQQSLTTTFRRSNAGQRDRTLTVSAGVARQRFDAYNAETVSLTGTLARASTPIWQKRWTWSVGTELLASRETRFQTATQDRTKNTYLIAALPLQVGYDRSNSLLDPTKGYRLTARVSPEVQKRTSGSFDRYARLLLEGSVYFPAMDSLVLAGRARVGSIIGASRDAIAPSRRYYSGGGGSVRGFGYQQLGPKDIDNNPIGGRSVTEFAFEARYRFGNFGIVPFVDAGRVGESSVPSLSGMRYGAGIGGRYYTNFGPMRVDVATPIGRRKGESKVALYISIGQAF